MEKQQAGEKMEKDMKRLRSLHDEAFQCIAEGIKCEEKHQSCAALQLYLSGKEKLLEALLITVPQGDKNQAANFNMQIKMKKHLEELKARISSLQKEGPRNEAPPPYQEMNGNSGAATAAVLGRPQSMMSEEIFCIPEGVFLFQVSRAGAVSSRQPSASLQVMCLIPSDPCSSAELNKAGNEPPSAPALNNPPPAFLQVGDWVCPLVPGQTVVLKTGYGAYMFPDLGNNNSEHGLEFVGIILPAELSTEERDNFEHLLVELTLYREEEGPAEPEPSAPGAPLAGPLRTEPRFSEQLSDVLVKGAGLLGSALTKGTEWTGYWVQRGAHKLRERINPEDKPVRVDPRLQTGLQVARSTTSAVRRCSGFLVGKLSEMTFALAQHAAPHVRHYGNRLLVKSGMVDQVDAANNNNVIDDICVVAAGGVKGFSVLYMSLETAARQLASCLASETVQVVHHKYGAEASEVVDHAVSSLGNLALATNNIRSFGVKAIAKRTAKETGKAVLQDYVERNPNNEPQQ